MGAPITQEQGRRQGEVARDSGVLLLLIRREWLCRSAELAFIKAVLANPTSGATIDDATEDLAAKFADNGKWRGAAVLRLRMARLTCCVGHRPSSRPSRHGDNNGVWAARDIDGLHRRAAELRQWFKTHPEPPADDDPQTSEAASVLPDAASKQRSLFN